MNEKSKAGHVGELKPQASSNRVIRYAVDGPPGYADRGLALPHVVLVHGFKGFYKWGFFPELAGRIAAAGMVAVRVNLSGCGVGPDLESFSEPEAFEQDTPSLQQRDLDLVREHVLGDLPCVDSSSLGLMGHSRGGGVALLHAAKHGDYSAVVTWATIESYDLEPSVREQWRSQGFLPVTNARTGQVFRIGLDALDDLEKNADALDIREAARRLESPLLLFHGTSDEAVPCRASEAIARLAPRAELRLVEGSGHTFGATHPLERVGEDLESVLSGTVEHFESHLRDR